MTDNESLADFSPKMIRNSPPVFPTGFRFGNINNESLIVDFVDAAQDGEATIFASIVLSQTTAENLFKGLQGFLENEQKQE